MVQPAEFDLRAAIHDHGEVRGLCAGGGDADAHHAGAFLLEWDGARLERTALPDLPAPLAYACGAVAGEVAYLAGGREQPDSLRASDAFWSLDLSAAGGERRWRALESWPGSPRMLAVAGALDGAFFLFGGVRLVDGGAGGDGSTAVAREYLRDAYRYDPGRGWKRVADLPWPVAAAPGPAPPAGRSHLLVFGGDDGAHAGRAAELRDAHPGFRAEVLAYHPVTDTWRVVDRLPVEPGPDPAGAAAAGTWAPVTTAAVPWRGGIALPTGEARPGVRTPEVLVARLLPRRSVFATLDYAVLGLYFAMLVGMGIYFARRERSTRDFFLGGQRIPWWAAGLSIFGTQLSAITFMAIPAKSFGADLVFLLANATILAVAPIVVWLYLPFFRRLEVTTAYEYLEHRFNLAARLLGSVSYLLFQLGRMGIVLFLPALALAAVTGVDVRLCILVMGVLATTYAVLGGIEAVIWTDVLQVVVLLGGAALSLAVVAGGVGGGLGGIIEMAAAHDKLRIANLDWSAATAALWVVLLGSLFTNLVPYTSDQSVVQRYLTTASEKDAARSVWTNGILSMPASLLFFFLGTALWAFYRSHPERLSAAGANEDVFPWFIATELPAGIAGLVIAGLFAAAMSSLDSSMNSMATAITTDFYRRFRPAASDRRCLTLARALTVLLGAAGTGCALALAASESTSMLDSYLAIVGLFGGGLAGLFAAGIFTRRANGPGAILGFLASALVLFAARESGAVHFLLYALIGVITCVVVSVATSGLFPGAARDVTGLTLSRSRVPDRRRTG